MSINLNKLSPLMQQYVVIKEQYKDAIVLFQVGDFYEIFLEDAQAVAPLIGIALTSRGTLANGDPIPLCGVPIHVLGHYLTKLVNAGFKVAICDQTEPARPGKIVNRAVTQVLTPGTLTDPSLLKQKSASYLATIFIQDDECSLIFTEILTGQMFITCIKQSNLKNVESEISRFLPDEILITQNKEHILYINALKSLGYNLSILPLSFEADAKNWFLKQFELQENHFEQRPISECFAVSLLYKFLQKNNNISLSILKQLQFYVPEDFLMLDSTTQINLELIKNTYDSTSDHTLFSVIDQASTSMGSRTLKKWILRPLIKQELIEQRLDGIEFLYNKSDIRQSLKYILSEIGDMERTIGRIALNRAQLYDYVYLMKSSKKLPEIISILNDIQDISLFKSIKNKFSDLSEITQLLEVAINDDSQRDYIIKPGYNNKLDELRVSIENFAQQIVQLEKQEQERTGINSLKIKFNGAHGYGIEITTANAHLVPKDYIRIQTLTNRERYTNAILKDLEYQINKYKTDEQEIEKNIFIDLKIKIEKYIGHLKRTSHALAYLDAINGLAICAYNNRYCKPTFNTNNIISIESGFHPVVKTIIKDEFISNDTNLTCAEPVWIITGPNMGGKSTYLRQVALIQIMAQIGSFVPAISASLPIIDRIFTRIGASDNLAQGKSTFLIEMDETAQICNNATKDSLVILDEVGRGTSTYDGIAIAQAVLEHIFHNLKSKCLFATHYHEITKLANQNNGISCYYMASKKQDEQIVFLHKLQRGTADASFGIEVAKLANLPESIINRAKEILKQYSN